MIAPKCRICGAREHGHVCRGGTPAQRLQERNRQRHEAALAAPDQARPFAAAKAVAAPARPSTALKKPVPVIADDMQEFAPGPGGHDADDPIERDEDIDDNTPDRAPIADQKLMATKPGEAARPRRWHTEDGDDGEPRDVLDAVAPRKPARFYAPQGQCVFCDRRRAAARKSMQAVRERGEA